MSSVEVVEIGLIATAAAASLASTEFSSHVSPSYSSESLRMITLPSLGGPRKAWLSSPKRRWANLKS
jgi:hypothetical protein